jgi:hypothetical protein
MPRAQMTFVPRGRPQIPAAGYAVGYVLGLIESNPSRLKALRHTLDSDPSARCRFGVAARSFRVALQPTGPATREPPRLPRSENDNGHELTCDTLDTSRAGHSLALSPVRSWAGRCIAPWKPHSGVTSRSLAETLLDDLVAEE